MPSTACGPESGRRAGHSDRSARRVYPFQEADDELRTHAMVLAQAWRDGRRQAALARALKAVSVVALDEELGRRSGELLGKTKTADAIDAAVVLVAREGEVVVTSDPDDIARLARGAKRRLQIVTC